LPGIRLFYFFTQDHRFNRDRTPYRTNLAQQRANATAASGRSEMLRLAGLIARIADGINLMLTHMFVGTRPLIMEHPGVLIGKSGYGIEIRTGHQNLTGICKSHHALRDIDAIADDIGLTIDIPHQTDRT
jgi:hypothetical protein